MNSTQTNTFISQYWDAIACDPSKWCYVPNTYDVDGVELVGSPQMKLWSDLNNWKNPGRSNGANVSKIEELKENIKEEGINLDSPFVYYDIDTNDRINGEHRHLACNHLGISGWMMQGVRFYSEASKIRFALISNKKKKDVYNPISIDDVEATVRDLIQRGDISTDQEIKNEIKILGKGSISQKVLDRLANRILSERIMSGQIKGTNRLYEWNEDRFEIFVKNSNDEWVQNYFLNKSEITIYINMAYWSSRIGALFEKAFEAANCDSPLHLVFSVKLKKGESLETTRKKVFDDYLKKFEKKSCFIFGVNHERCKTYLPWNHPDCEHRFLPQSSEEDEKETIKL